MPALLHSTSKSHRDTFPSRKQMGPLFVLVFWAIVGTILSAAGGAILVTIVAFLTRRITQGRRRALTIAGLLPAAGFAYLFCCVIAFSVWSISRNRDWGWGDTWDTPIIGNYSLMMIDVPDEATLYNRQAPNTYNGSSAIQGVNLLEVRGPILLGTANNLFFILHTDTEVRQDFTSLNALSAEAQRLGRPLHLEPVDTIYGRYRYTKIDLIAVVLFMVPPIVLAFFLIRSLLRLIRSRPLQALET
jgi:hypothetical protein